MQDEYREKEFFIERFCALSIARFRYSTSRGLIEILMERSQGWLLARGFERQSFPWGPRANRERKTKRRRRLSKNRAAKGRERKKKRMRKEKRRVSRWNSIQPVINCWPMCLARRDFRFKMRTSIDRDRFQTNRPLLNDAHVVYVQWAISGEHFR